MIGGVADRADFGACTAYVSLEGDLLDVRQRSRRNYSRSFCVLLNSRMKSTKMTMLFGAVMFGIVIYYGL
jgi:hypothetical protein